MTQTTRRVASVGLTLILLAGCETPLPPQEALAPAQLTFETVKDRVAFDGAAPDWASVDGLLARNGARYGDRLVLSAETGVLAEAARRYASLGVRISAGTTPGSGQAVFLRTLVVPPECERWIEGVEEDDDNQPSPNYGCANLSNLARMVADPNDLIAGTEAGAYNSIQETLVVDRMRAGALEIERTTDGAITTGN